MAKKKLPKEGKWVPRRQAEAPIATNQPHEHFTPLERCNLERGKMLNDSYFSRLAANKRRLESHGLSSCPTQEELVDYAIELSDKIDALCSAYRVAILKDHRGNWRVCRTDDKE